MKRLLLICLTLPFLSTLFGQSLTESTAFTSLKIYPQPADEQVTISSDNRIQKIDFFTVAGALIQSHYVDNKSFTVSLLDFPSGIYLAKIFGFEGEEAVERISIY